MAKIIKNELYKFFKTKKNIIIIIVLFVYLLGINFYNLKEYKSYMKETKQIYHTKYLQAEGNWRGLSRLLVNADTLSDKEIDEIEKQMDFYRAERGSLRFIEAKFIDNRPEYYEDILVYTNERYNNMLKGLDNGAVTEKEINLRKEDIEKEIYLNQYILDNKIEPTINPYTMTGANSLVLFLEGNNLIILIFLIALLSVDIYLSEIEEGSYKVVYTQPFKRKDVFFGKIITISIVSLLLLGLAAILNFGILSIIYGIGNLNYPFITNEIVKHISFSNVHGEYIILPLWKFVVMGFGLLVPIIIFTITLIIFISIYTDSNKKTMGFSIMLLVLAFIFNNFLTRQSIVNLIYPYCYLYIRNAIEINNRSNYLFGIILNSLMSIGLFMMSYYKFIRKDFLGAKE